jgi:integrase
MDQSGLSARAAADQLGHSHPSLTQDVYYGRRIASTGAAEVLEALDAGIAVTSDASQNDAEPSG